MKVKDTAMGKFIAKYNKADAIWYIYQCLKDNGDDDNVFWQVVVARNLRAPDPILLAEKVYECLPEFDYDEVKTGDE